MKPSTFVLSRFLVPSAAFVICLLAGWAGCAKKKEYPPAPAKSAPPAGASSAAPKTGKEVAVAPVAESSRAAEAPLGDVTATETAAVAPAGETTGSSAAVAANVEPPAPVGPDGRAAHDQHVLPGDWNQWLGSSTRNNTPEATGIPTEWKIGEFDYDTNEWKKETSQNVKWVARLGSESYGNPVVANGQVYVGTNNNNGWLPRYPAEVDLGVILCFRESDGQFLWQHSSEKLPTGRVNDWPNQGICSAPLVEGERLWTVTSRGEVRCLDTQGFRDNNENDGSYTSEAVVAENEADVIWVMDMMKQLGVSQHNMCSCSVTAAGDLLFVITGNGVDEGHRNLPSPRAPSFLCLDKNTGEVLWTDNTPGPNVLHGQWSSPSYAVFGGVPQVLFGGGDGYLYSFLAARTPDGKPQLLWKFDCNPKESKYALTGATRNHVIGTPVIHDGLVYIAVGEDPEHGEGDGHLWCIDPTKRGDVSPELAFNVADLSTPIPPRREQAVIKEQGEVARANPNSAAVWHYVGTDLNGNGELDIEERMHRSCGSVAIKDGLLFIADFPGIFHCLDVKTGQALWTYDMLAASWASPLIVENRVYIGDEDGDITIFKLSKEMEIISKDDYGDLGPINMGNSVYTTPVIANNQMFIANRSYLFCIAQLDDAAAETAQATPATETTTE